jgi:hypothetical protein
MGRGTDRAIRGWEAGRLIPARFPPSSPLFRTADSSVMRPLSAAVGQRAPAKLHGTRPREFLQSTPSGCSVGYNVARHLVPWTPHFSHPRIFGRAPALAPRYHNHHPWAVPHFAPGTSVGRSRGKQPPFRDKAGQLSGRLRCRCWTASCTGLVGAVPCNQLYPTHFPESIVKWTAFSFGLNQH